MNLKQWLNLVFRKKLILDGFTIKCKSRKALRAFEKFLKTFNIDLYIQDKWFEDITKGFCITNFEEDMKNDRYKLDK